MGFIKIKLPTGTELFPDVQKRAGELHRAAPTIFGLMRTGPGGVRQQFNQQATETEGGSRVPWIQSAAATREGRPTLKDTLRLYKAWTNRGVGAQATANRTGGAVVFRVGVDPKRVPYAAFYQGGAKGVIPRPVSTNPAMVSSARDALLEYLLGSGKPSGS